ncbi:MAG TPA: hypothetical protein VM097_12815 [Mycobacteriales bacterium]|nr:hypothetical protein [Mycobacteriales bacterium]
MKRSSLLPVAGTVAAVTALGVTIALVQPGGSGAPRPLHLAAGGGTAERDAAAPMAAGSSAGGSGYTLTGSLPAGRPDDAPAYTLPKGPADASLVSSLARALKAGTPVRDGDGWRAGGLFVSGDAGQSWWFSPCAKDTPVAEGERVACAYDVGVVPAPRPADGGGATPDGGTTDGSSGSGTTDPSSGSGSAVAPPPPVPSSPVPEPEPMSKDAVRAAAAPVFDALGLDAADARVEGWPYGGSAMLARTVGGLEVWGMQTHVQVDREGAVQSAGGFLATPDKGDSYPLVTAQDAYDDLPPMMTTMLCPVGPDGKGCAAPEPVEVTGARLGLMLSALVDGGQALVPAWLFEVKGWTEPIAVVAVQAQYLPQPTPEPTSKPEPGVSTEPGGAVPPAPPDGGDPGTARQPVRVDKAYAGEGSTLIAVYGQSGSCPLENVIGEAKETADAVYLVLQADAPVADRACTDDYNAVEHVVRLQAPLGDRKVVDASTNKPVPRT